MPLRMGADLLSRQLDQKVREAPGRKWLAFAVPPSTHASVNVCEIKSFE